MITETINLNFFGYVIKLESNAINLLKQIKYIYREYLCSCPENYDYYFFIKNNSKDNFILSELIDNDAIQILHGHNETNLKLWDDSNSFLPPITAPYFREYFSFFHGCAIRIEDRTVVFFGPSRSGKTTIIMEALDKGAQLISDDIIIIQNKTSKILTFKKPIGLRNTSNYFFENRFQKVVEKNRNSIPTFEVKELNLVTELIHITDIPKWSYFDLPSNIDEVYFIDDKNVGEEIVTIYDFMKKVNKQACISTNSLKIMIEVYKNLNCNPKVINIRDRVSVLKMLDI